MRGAHLEDVGLRAPPVRQPEPRAVYIHGGGGAGGGGGEGKEGEQGEEREEVEEEEHGSAPP